VGVGLGTASRAEQLTYPWRIIPTLDEVKAAYPSAARAQGIGGRAVIECTVTSHGFLADCAIASEDPPGAGFGQAALALSASFSMGDKLADGTRTSGMRVRIPLRFEPTSNEPPTRQVRFPHSPGEYAGLGPVGPYYPERASRQGKTGFATVDCHISAGGVLSRCQVVSETGNNGFGDAAMIMALRHWIVAEPKADGSPEGPDEIGRLTVPFGILRSQKAR